jgi:hypothetical protein
MIAAGPEQCFSVCVVVPPLSFVQLICVGPPADAIDPDKATAVAGAPTAATIPTAMKRDK